MRKGRKKKKGRKRGKNEKGMKKRKKGRKIHRGMVGKMGNGKHKIPRCFLNFWENFLQWAWVEFQVLWNI